MTVLNKELTMGPKARREREKEQLRQEILDAARELFLKEGYENVSMRRIAEKIEYSPTTIYLYFEDKAELLFAICEETFAKLYKKLVSIYEKHDDPVECLRLGGRAYVEFGLKYPNHYKVTFINHPQLHVGKEHYLREDSMGMRAFDQMRRKVADCVEKKLFKEPDVDAISQTLWAVLHGLTALLITKPDFPWVKREKLIDLTVNSAINGLLL
jgi:AcrR family transcriptional regulator